MHLIRFPRVQRQNLTVDSRTGRVTFSWDELESSRRLSDETCQPFNSIIGPFIPLAEIESSAYLSGWSRVSSRPRCRRLGRRLRGWSHARVPPCSTACVLVVEESAVWLFIKAAAKTDSMAASVTTTTMVHGDDNDNGDDESATTGAATMRLSCECAMQTEPRNGGASRRAATR